MREYIKPLAATLWLLLSGCSTSPEIPFTPEQIQSLTDVGQLQDLHRSLSTQLAEGDPEKFPAEFSLLDGINQRLIELHKTRLEGLLESKRIRWQGSEKGVVPLPDLAQLKQELADTLSSAPSLLPLASAPINREEAVTGKLIQELIAESNNPDISAERRALVYDHLFKVSGDVVWQKGRDNQMDVIIKSIHATTANNVFNEHLEQKVDFVRSIYVDQPAQIVSDMHGVYADIYAHRFFAAVKRDKPTAAFKILQDLALKPDYEQIKGKLQPSALRMAAYFADYFAAIVGQNGNLAQSFLFHGREIEARRILGLQPQPHPQTAALADQLFTKFKTLESQKSHFAALGVLSALEIIDPKFADLASLSAQQESQIKNSAIRSVNLVDFRSRYKEYNYGEIITPIIGQHLSETVGQEVQVIRPDTAASNVAADALISGNILEVKVDSSRTTRKRKLQVTVGQDERPNPAYIAWLKLSPKERAKQEKPAETIFEDKKGEIYITTTLHRKAAVFAVSYRLATIGSDPVVFPDSITLQAEYEDESNEGIEAGELVIPYKVAKLPADAEILEKLARDVAEVIAGNLAAILQNQEIEYLKIADRSAAQEDCKREVESLAKAITLMHVKNVASNKLRARLGERSLACF